MKIRHIPIRLQVAPSCYQTYAVVSFKQAQNYNGAVEVLRIVMVFFKNGIIIIAYIQLTLVYTY